MAERNRTITPDIESRLGLRAVLAGHSVVRVAPYSDHPGDWYLARVLARKIDPRDQERSFATWLANFEAADRPFLFEGHYELTEAEAEVDFARRR